MTVFLSHSSAQAGRLCPGTYHSCYRGGKARVSWATAFVLSVGIWQILPASVTKLSHTHGQAQHQWREWSCSLSRVGASGTTTGIHMYSMYSNRQECITCGHCYGLPQLLEHLVLPCSLFPSWVSISFTSVSPWTSCQGIHSNLLISTHLTVYHFYVAFSLSLCSFFFFHSFLLLFLLFLLHFLLLLLLSYCSSTLLNKDEEKKKLLIEPPGGYNVGSSLLWFSSIYYWLHSAYIWVAMEITSTFYVSVSLPPWMSSLQCINGSLVLRRYLEPWGLFCISCLPC